MFTLYNDAKRGTLSAWSWPSREVASMRGNQFNISDDFTPLQAGEVGTNYLSPEMYRSFLSSNVQADLPRFRANMQESVALSLHVDGSVDRTQVDNIHIMGKVVSKQGLMNLAFLGFEEPECRGAQGYMKAVKEATQISWAWETVLNAMSSIVTDGASINTGEKGGLWSLLESQIKAQDQNKPLLKIWCAAHRAALAWENLTSSVVEAMNIVRSCASLSTFFHTSALRNRELRSKASELNLKLVQFPPLFEVRWTEFTHSLLSAILQSWQALVAYFQRERERENKDTDRTTRQGFLKTLTSLDKLRLLCVMCDLAYLYKRFQKHMDGDNIVSFDIKLFASQFLQSVQNLKNRSLLGGLEEQLNERLVRKGDVFTLHGVELTVDTPRRTSQCNKFVTDKRSFMAIRNEILETIENFVQQRLDTGEFSALSPLEKFDSNVTDDQLKQRHAKICPEMALIDFATSYREAAADRRLAEKKCSGCLTLLGAVPSWRSLFVAVARVAAATPSSSDVERLISYYNLVKTRDRSSLDKSRMKDYLHVRFNMPCLSEFDPLPAVRHWLEAKDRRSKCTTVKSTAQEWYRHVFPQDGPEQQHDNADTGSTPNLAVSF
jgi:hypothetical protein